MEVKYKILDTNILLTDPNKALNYSFRPKEGMMTYLILPIVVIEELDRLKHEQTERGRNARESSLILKQIKQDSSQPYSKGIKVGDNYFIRVVTGLEQDIEKCFRKADEDVRRSFPSKDANINLDNRILAIALAYKRQYGEGKNLKKNEKPADVELITQDTNLVIKASAFEVIANDWTDMHVIKKGQEFYKGCREVKLDSETYLELLCGIEEQPDTLINPSILGVKNLFPNEFLRLIDEKTMPQQSMLAKNDPFKGGIRVFARCYENEANEQKILSFEEHKYPIIDISPRNYQQACALEALLDKRIGIVHLIGPAGTGKTLMALAVALHELKEDEDLEILLTKPIVSIGSSTGYLPGTQQEKLTPWMQGMMDNLYLMSEKEEVKSLMSQEKIKLQALETIRGRSINNGFYIVDEAQNLTRHQIKTIISRMGDVSKIVVIGDPHQIDDPLLNTLSTGLLHSSETFKGLDCSATIYLPKGERGKLATLAAELL